MEGGKWRERRGVWGGAACPGQGGTRLDRRIVGGGRPRKGGEQESRV